MSRVATVAQGWVGTPFVHGASVRGVGTDCLGLLRGVWREVVGPEPVRVPPYAGGRSISDEGLLVGVAAALPRVAEDAPLGAGQVLLFRMRDAGWAQHVGILTEAGSAPRFVHAYSGRAVVESWLSVPWARRIVARFDWPLEG